MGSPPYSLIAETAFSENLYILLEKFVVFLSRLRVFEKLSPS